jgi:hypothetical protein
MIERIVFTIDTASLESGAFKVGNEMLYRVGRENHIMLIEDIRPEGARASVTASYVRTTNKLRTMAEFRDG